MFCVGKMTPPQKKMTPFSQHLFQLFRNRRKTSCGYGWCPDGISIFFQDESRKRFMKQYSSRTQCFQSFVRQLNLYGFSRVYGAFQDGDRPPCVCFQHPFFQRRHPKLLPKVRRQTLKLKTKPKTEEIKEMLSSSSQMLQPSYCVSKTVRTRRQRERHLHLESDLELKTEADDWMLIQCLEEDADLNPSPDVFESEYGIYFQ